MGSYREQIQDTPNTLAQGSACVLQGTKQYNEHGAWG